MKLLRDFGLCFAVMVIFSVLGCLFLGEIGADFSDGRQTSQTQIARILDGPDEHTFELGRFALFEYLRWNFLAEVAIASLLFVGLKGFTLRFFRLKPDGGQRVFDIALLTLLSALSLRMGSSMEIRTSVQVLDNPLAADVRVCPDGHTTLRDVPIEYGLLHDSEKVRRAVENLEFIPGGCVYSPGFSETSKVVCTTCRLQFWGKEMWHGSSTNLAGFARTLTALATRLPFASQGGDGADVRWAQMIRSNRVEKEYIYLQVQLPVEKVCSTITNWLAEFDIHAEFMRPKRNAWGPGRETDYYYLGASCVCVELRHYLQETNVYINITHDRDLDGRRTNPPCARSSKM